MASTTFVATQRSVVGAPAVLRWQPTDAEGEPVAAAGTVTVGVTRSDGTEVVAAGAATVADGIARTYTLPLAACTATDVLTAVWSVDGDAAATTTCELVGGVYLSIAAIRQLEPSLADVAKYPDAAIRTARTEVEALFEDACHRAFVPRFRVDEVAGTNRWALVLRRPDVRAIRWAVEVDWRGTESTINVSSVDADPSGVAIRRGSVPWPPPTSKVRIGYEYGLSRPPDDLLRAIVTAIRMRLNTPKSAVPDRAVSFTQVEGGTVQLATPGVYGWITGVPEIDEALKRHRFKDAGIA